jgi:hypothetical protein
MAETILEHITRLTNQLSAEDKLSLVEHLAKSLKQDRNEHSSDQQSPVSLRGIWREHFPEDFDAEKEIRSIRGEWEKEWPEVFKQ